MAFEYFGDVETQADFVAVNKKYDYDQLLQYEPFTRTQMADELRQLYVKFKLDVPLFILELLDDPNKHSMIALQKGYYPSKTLIDQINDDHGLNIKNPTELREVLFTKSDEVTASSDELPDVFESEDELVKAALSN